MESLNNWHLAYSARSIFISIFTLSLLATIEAGMTIHRRLLEVDRDGYPSWLHDGDRALIYQLQKEGIIQPNATVAKDGTGQYKTVAEGINSYPKNYQGRYIVYVKAGIYQEYVTVDGSKNNILLYGNDPTTTIITGSKNQHEGIKMPQTATFATFGQNFIAKSITFENIAGPIGEQAVALRVTGDHSSFFNCEFRGYQDTLYVENGRQFYRNCKIYGTIDFIYGRSTTLIQKSTILMRKPALGQSNVVVADGTDKNTDLSTGIVLQNCSITPDAELIPFLPTVKTYLARPWQAFSTAVFLNNYIDDFIHQDGYMIWEKDQPNIENPYFAEFGNIGPGANATARVKWAKGIITRDEATKFTAEPWIGASTWLNSTGIPYDGGFMAKLNY